MKVENYKKMYEKMETSKEMDQKILHAVKNGKTSRRGYLKAVGIAAAFALVAGMYHTPTVNAAVKMMIQSFTNQFIINNEKIEMSGDYQTIKSTADKSDKKMRTLKEAEQELGVSLLKFPEAYEGEENLISYQPYVSEAGEVYGVKLIDKCYAVGDLQAFTVETSSSASENNSMTFREGSEYQTPIAAEITVRSQSDTADSKNFELNYFGSKEELRGESEQYELKKINTKAVIATINNSGVPRDWEESAGETMDITMADLLYEGVEYRYYGAVSKDTMKKFLDQLSY